MHLAHVLSTKQFLDTGLLERLFDVTLEMEYNVTHEKFIPSLQGKILATLFYEPSTRTRFSFESAMLRLGGKVITTESAGQFSSATKGETLEDTIRIVSGYADGIVLRHSEEGASARAAEVSRVPIINAGDGPGEHPTQALLDMYTIWREKGTMKNLEIVLMGDLKNGRTVHSLLHLLVRFKPRFVHLVSPELLRLPEKYRVILQENGIPFEERPSLPADVSSVDVVYMTRVQKERFASEAEYNDVKDCCVITPETMQRIPMDAIVMHPLPRVTEIHPDVDKDPRAAYFRQATNGLYVRMALLQLLFQKKSLEQETLKWT